MKDIIESLNRVHAEVKQDYKEGSQEVLDLIKVLQAKIEELKAEKYCKVQKWKTSTRR